METASSASDKKGLAGILKSEMVRISRKVVRESTADLAKSSATRRHDIADIKRRLAAIESGLKKLQKQAKRLEPAPSEPAPTDGRKGPRFRAEGLITLRKRLGLSAADFGKLIDVAGQTIYKWEQGISHPRRAQLERLAQIRSIGKKEAAARLA